MLFFVLLFVCSFDRVDRVFFARGRTDCTEQGLCRIWKRREKHMKKSQRSCVEKAAEFHQNSSKMTQEWRQNGTQSGSRGSRGSKSHAKITKTRPEALGSGTVVAFWRKSGAQGGPKGAQKSTKIHEKSIKNCVDFQVYF